MSTDEPSSRDRQAIKAWLSVVRAYHLCDAAMSTRLAALGLRTAEHEVLANLARSPGMSQQALAARCFTAKSHISAVLRSMEERGWVRREDDPDDARARRLYLTRSGQALARRSVAAQSEVVDAMVRSETVRDLAFVEAAMNRVGERLEALNRASAPRSRRPPPGSPGK
jgi:DNA-binding MarR family transcriptional regulator